MAEISGDNYFKVIFLILFNLGFIFFIVLYSFFIQIEDQSNVGVPIFLLLLVFVATGFIPIAIPFGKKGIAVASIWGVLSLVFGIISLYITPIGGINYIFNFYFFIGLATWMNLYNHCFINDEPIRTLDPDKETKKLHTYLFAPKTEQMENLLVILAFMYLFATILFYIIGNFIVWQFGIFITVIMGVFALNMFWYATKYSKTSTYLAFGVGNVLLVMVVLSNLGIITEFHLFIDLIITNIGFLLLGAPTVRFAKDHLMRRILIFNWIAWSIYFTGGLIFSVYQYETGIFIEFFTKFIEVSIIVGGAYKESSY